MKRTKFSIVIVEKSRADGQPRAYMREVRTGDALGVCSINPVTTPTALLQEEVACAFHLLQDLSMACRAHQSTH